MMQFFVTLLLALAAGSQAFAAERAIIVLDASGSMWGQIDGKTKIRIARETLGGVLQSVPGNLELGLIAYGHRATGKCDDIELIVPVAPATARRIAAAANRLSPKGKTPLAASVRRAADALRYTEEKATVILITDGLENCSADPCALATELENSGVDFTVHVVGFGLSEEQSRQVACVAENTGGKYTQAKDASELGSALAQTVAEVAVPEPVALAANLKAMAVLAQGGPVVDERDDVRWDVWRLDGAGQKAKTPKTSHNNTLEGLFGPGRYVIGARLGAAAVEVETELKADELSELTLNLNATRLIVHGRRSAGAGTDKGVRWEVTLSGRRTATAQGGDAQFVIPAGSRKITGKLGETMIEDALELVAGQTVEKDYIIATGQLVAHAVLAQGGPMVDARNDLRWDVWRLDGAGQKAKTSRTSYGKTLEGLFGPGRYVIGARLGDAAVEVEADLKADELSELTLNLNATRLIVHGRRSAGAETDKGVRWDVTLADNRMATAYGGDAQFVIPAGSRKITGKLGETMIEDALELVAGQTVEKDYIIATGRLVAHAVLAENGPRVEGYVRFDVLGATKDTTGKRKDFSTNYGDGAEFDLPPGDYVLIARVGEAIVEAPVTIEPDALSEPVVNMNAGILTITAPGGDRIDIVGATKDIAGNSKNFGTKFGESWQIALPVGNYVVKVRKKDRSVIQGAASVTAGQRTEVTVE